MSSFWQGRSVLVTGADGFIGSHLVERLCAEGAKVRAFCFYNSNGSLGWLDEASEEVRKDLDPWFGDIRDSRRVESACDGVDTVFHLAALIAIPYSYAAPQSFIETNIGGTLNVLEGVRRKGCRRVVHTSTSEVYGTPARLPIRETHPLQGQSPYAASKIGADALCESFLRSFDVPVVVLRPFNTYGPRQSTRAVLPTILAQLLEGQSRIRLGNLAPKRDLTFILDTVDGFVRAGAAVGVEGEVIQLGTGNAVSIGDLLIMAARVVGVEVEVITEPERVRPDRSEVMVLESDPVKAASRLDWHPRYSLEEGITLTAEWIRSHRTGLVIDRFHV